MNQIRVLGVDTSPKTFTPGEIEELLNRELIFLEKNGSRPMNIIPCGDKGFLILHEEPFTVMK